MQSLKFDGIIFGNGMTINLLEQLKPFVKEEKQYLLNLDDFMEKFISSSLPPREEGIIFNVFYKKKNTANIKYFQQVKDELNRYYVENDSNIEQILGRDIFISKNNDIGYDMGAIMSFFPAFYNIWFNILYEYIVYLGLEKYIDTYYKSIGSVILNFDNIYTTNFDYFADDSLDPKHLHGRFVKNIKKYEDVRLYIKSDKEFYFKYIWGYNGLGKLNLINQINNLTIPIGEYFDFDFFYGKNTKINNLLVYGLGFQRHGAITKEFLEKFPKYNTEIAFGSVVDEHIIIRLKVLQDLNKIKNVVVSYYSGSDKNYFQLLFNYHGIKNIRFVHTSEFDFSIKSS